MHKRFVNHCTIELVLSPSTPILIKSGKEGADPTKPDMEFVETYHAGGKSIYLPGSSLKGAIRAHAERIVRTVGSDRNPNNPSKLWASNPLNRSSYDYLEPFQGDAPKIYQHSSFTDQLFGSTEIASRLRIEDAYPIDRAALRIEERNGVAIDRVFGSVIPGALFNFQVCTAGEFRTKIHLKNFSLEQLGLLGLVLRDLNDGWFGLGFAKSRGLGIVEARLEKAIVQYPGCILNDNNIVQVGREQSWSAATLIGAGAFLEDEEREKYGFASEDIQPVTLGVAEKMALGFGVQLTWENDAIEQVFEAAVKAWSKRLGVAA
jgi:CRISPR-associated RAMP protein (TIGR02581 family)